LKMSGPKPRKAKEWLGSKEKGLKTIWEKKTGKLCTAVEAEANQRNPDQERVLRNEKTKFSIIRNAGGQGKESKTGSQAQVAEKGHFEPPK